MLLPAPYRRIYFHHIRRVGGTSLNQSFFALATNQPGRMSARLRRSKTRVLRLHGLLFVGANKSVLEGGDYFYGFSHIPAHQLRLPNETFTIAIFRDPVARVLSHYTMLLTHAQLKHQRPFFAVEKQWLGGSLRDFLTAMPQERLLAQLFAFSAAFDIREAAARIAECSAIFSTEHYDAGLRYLATVTHLPLASRHSHRSRLCTTVSDSTMRLLKRFVEPERELLSLLRSGSNARGL